MTNSKITLSELKFRKIKEKERMPFYEYAFESGKEHATNVLGLSFDYLKKICKINRILLGLPLRIFARNMKDYFAELDDEIVAGFSIFFDKKKDKYELGNVFTRPKFQGRGIGNLVMKEVLSSYGHKKIELSVDETNDVAIHLYYKYGFKKEYTTAEYVEELPFETKTLPNGYSLRIAKKEDLSKLEKITKAFPKLNDIPKIYKKSFNKTEKRKFRMMFQLPGILLHGEEIVGIGRVIWNSGVPETAQMSVFAVLNEASDAYPCLVSFLTDQTMKYGLKKMVWDRTEKTEAFANEMEQFLGQPTRTGLKMRRELSS
ncbi:MAG: GNAT family N-acetyltransferase [Asgard group archaeon]|nr:GNAT family N-acetyltransferase [Asgard group archaeon]